MKKILLALLFVPAISSLSYGQCDQKVVLTSSKTEHLASDSSVERTNDEQTTIEFDKTSITVTPGDHTMTGKVLSHTCNWKVPFKEGKSVLKATLSNDNGESKNVTITIEGKNGKINFLAELDDADKKRIRLQIDKFEEKK